MWLKLPSFKYIKIDSGALKQVQMIKKKKESVSLKGSTHKSRSDTWSGQVFF